MRRAFVLALLLVLPALAAPVPEGAGSSQPLPRGMADAEGKLGVVTGADGGLDALDLATGKVLWSSKLAQRAVAIDGKRVLALANTGNKLSVVVLDAADGKKLSASEPIKLPDWAAVRLGVVTSDAGRSFQTTTRLHKGDLYVRWQAASWYWGGAAPTPEIEAAARKNAEGVARIDLDTGKVEAVPADRWAAVAGVPAEVEKIAKALPAPKHLTVAGDVAALVEVAGTKAVLRRWNLKDATALEPVTLLEAPALRVEMAPASGRVLVHKAVAKEKLPPGDHAWWVFDLATGKQVAKVAFVPTTSEATVVGPRAYFVVSPADRPRPFPGGFGSLRTLRAVELATGKMLWEHPLEPIRRSPPPP